MTFDEWEQTDEGQAAIREANTFTKRGAFIMVWEAAHAQGRAEGVAAVNAAQKLYDALKWLRSLTFENELRVWPGEETQHLVDDALAAYDAIQKGQPNDHQRSTTSCFGLR